MTTGEGGEVRGAGATGDSAVGTGLPPLVRDVLSLLGEGMESRPDDERFDRLALAIVRERAASSPAYSAFLRARGADPERLERWTSIPPVPARAFKVLPELTASASEAVLRFRTSGTTEGEGARGEHRVRFPQLYRASLLPNFQRHLLPGGPEEWEDLALLSWIPSPRALPDSSLSAMMGFVAERFFPGRSHWLAEGGAADGAATLSLLHDAQASGRPLLLAGTAFALVHLLDALRERGQRFDLAPGTRVMETGGYKGRSRVVPREELYREISASFGVPMHRIVNEYGMTELLSQFYEPVLPEGGPDDPAERRLVGPPWVRTRILDPETLQECPPGKAGLLCHYDLANAASVFGVLTEDLGVAVGDGFRVLGRVRGAEPRGCSLSMEALPLPTEGEVG